MVKKTRLPAGRKIVLFAASLAAVVFGVLAIALIIASVPFIFAGTSEPGETPRLFWVTVGVAGFFTGIASGFSAAFFGRMVGREL